MRHRVQNSRWSGEASWSDSCSLWVVMSIKLVARSTVAQQVDSELSNGMEHLLLGVPGKSRLCLYAPCWDLIRTTCVNDGDEDEHSQHASV